MQRDRGYDAALREAIAVSKGDYIIDQRTPPTCRSTSVFRRDAFEALGTDTHGLAGKGFRSAEIAADEPTRIGGARKAGRCKHRPAPIELD